MMTSIDTSAEEIIATCSAEFGIMIVPGVFIIAELMRPITATSTPGPRPAMVVARTIAGMKKMKVTRPCVTGYIAQ